MEEKQGGRGVAVCLGSVIPEGEDDEVGETLMVEGGTPRFNLGGTGGSGSVEGVPLKLRSPRLRLWTGVVVPCSVSSPEFKPSRTVKHRDS